MKNSISKKPIGSSITYRKSKFNNFRVLPFVLLTSIFLLTISTFFLESGKEWAILDSALIVENTPSDSDTMTFMPAFRITDNTNTIIQKSSYTSHRGYLKLLANSGDSNHSTEFYFNNNASLGLDPGYDASFFNGNIPEFSIYSHLVENNSGTAFSVQTLGGNDINSVTIPLGLHATQGQDVTISIFQTDIEPFINIYLEDSLNNTSTLLNTSSYDFTAISDLTGTGRFYLRFENQSLSLSESLLDSLSIYTNQSEKSIIIKGELQSNTNIKLYNINGREVLTELLNNSENKHTINVEHLSTDVYVLELTNTHNAKRIEKLIIK